MKRFISILLAVILVFAVIACGSSKDDQNNGNNIDKNADSSDTVSNALEDEKSENNKEKFTIGISFANENAARWPFDERYMVETIEEAGGEALVQWANYDQTKQENQIDNLITQGIDALILIAVSSNMSPTVEKVKEHGIPVVCYDNYVIDAPLDAYLDRDNIEAGRIQMRATIDAIGGEGKIAIIHGEPTSSVVLGMKDGYDEVLADNPDVNVIMEQYCEAYNAEKALKYAENALTAHGDELKAIVCTADVLTLGVLNAVESAGLAGKVFLTGMDCEVAAMQAVYRGDIGIDIWTKLIFAQQMLQRQQSHWLKEKSLSMTK